STPTNTPHLKNRKTYQASPFNANDVLKSTHRDIGEGADIVMVKPAVAYMDVISRLHRSGLDVPLAAYHVSGEYQSVELLAMNNLIDRIQAHTEVWASLKRAGADIIISYAARHAREWISKIEY
ncbi:MAG: porphobilinogen synthase, partial [Ferruginibacter sp.]|nr:porphobilinogen synthase [Ferruginibacter sp.]